MKRAIILVGAMVFGGHAMAMYQCKDAEGKVSFQQSPCPAGTKQAEIDIKATPPSGQAAAPDGQSDKRTLERYQRERRVRELQASIKDVQEALDARNGRMAAELDALHARKRSANNNLAGATYQQSLSTEMQAIATKYQAANDVDLARLRALQSDLTAAQAAIEKKSSTP